MTILSGLIAVFNRLLGSAATATVGWATVMLFGRVSQKKQQLLSLIALGSLVWIVAVVAVVVPTIGGALITSVPRPGFVSIDWLRFVLLALAVLLPLGIGVATVTAADGDDRPKGIALVIQILRGYLITPVLAGMILFLAAVSVIRQARAMQKGWDDAHIPIIVKPGRYDAVADDIESALRESGLEITRKAAPRTLEVAPRLLMAVGGGSAHRDFPDELAEFDADELNVILYPYDVLMVGREASVGRARPPRNRRRSRTAWSGSRSRATCRRRISGPSTTSSRAWRSLRAIGRRSTAFDSRSSTKPASPARPVRRTGRDPGARCRAGAPRPSDPRGGGGRGGTPQGSRLGDRRRRRETEARRASCHTPGAQGGTGRGRRRRRRWGGPPGRHGAGRNEGRARCDPDRDGQPAGRQPEDPDRSRRGGRDGRSRRCVGAS